MKVKDLAYATEDGTTINMMIDHPQYGWVPFSARADDVEEHGRQMHAEAKAGKLGPIAAYTPPPAPSTEALDATARATRAAHLQASDWTQLADARRSMGATLASQWDAYRQALRDLPSQPGWPATISWPKSPAEPTTTTTTPALMQPW